MQRRVVSTLTEVRLPKRFEFAFNTPGLLVRRISERPRTAHGQFAPFKTRGDDCRRIVFTDADQSQTVIELAAFSDVYDPPVAAAIRAKVATVEGTALSLPGAEYRLVPADLAPFANVRDAVHQAWGEGIRYRRELRNLDGTIARTGLRMPQLGALHAIAAHWTVSPEPAIVVMPTGTGKTEVMMATAVADNASRLLVIVPTDALRQQTADKFATYGLLDSIGIIDNLPLPVVGILSSKPSADHFDGVRACNVVVTTMSSIGLADGAVQQEFANLFTHVFFDEAHHSVATTWKKFRKCCERPRVVLFTATPYREDGKALEGKIIYEFPLGTAQDQGYFRPIRFIEVFEPDDALADRRIADAAVAKLRQDLADGYSHMLMARTNSIERAEGLFNNIYARLFADLNPVLIHSRTPGKKALLNDVQDGRHKIVVCVDMFGEGFDLPSLKVAALHSVHKSIGVTLQFIGRFSRAQADVGDATFVANTAEDGVPEALETLYQEDADWNRLLADLSYDAINPQAKLSLLVDHLQPVGLETSTVDISTLALRPKISAQVYRTGAFRPARFAQAFGKSQKVHHPQISHQDKMLVLVVNQKEKLDWTDSRDIGLDGWDLYIAYYDEPRQLLFIHCSRKGNATTGLAKAISEDPQQVAGEDIFKTFAGLKRLSLHSVGLTSRSKNVRYQMFAGLDVRNAIDPVLQQDKMKSNVTGVGYEAGKRHTVGGSRKGKMWAMSSGSIAQWRDWCDRIGAKLTDPSAQPNDFLRFTLLPSIVDQTPAAEGLLADWPDQLFEAWNFRFEVWAAGTAYDFHDCQIDLVSWQPGGVSFQFALNAGLEVETILELRIQVPVPPATESTFTVQRVGGIATEIKMGGNRVSTEEFFAQNPPLVRLADGSQLSGNILLKPREALADTYDRDQIMTLGWQGVDFQKESRWKDGALRADSIQQHFISHLEAGPATFIIDDDDNGESADVVAIEEANDTLTVYLWHCKYAHGATPGERAADLYVLCGQAEKSCKWTWSLENLVKHLVVRESKHKRGRPSRFIRGLSSALVTLRKSARKKFVVFRVGIVQPGFSKANAPAEHLAIIGAANTFIQTVTDQPLLVYGSA